MRETRICSNCHIEKTLNKSSWYANNECSACRARERYQESNRNNYKNKWREQNKEHHLKYMREYKAEKLKIDTDFKLRNLLRKRLTEAIKNNSKTGSAVNDLGCSIKELKQRLESQFQKDMTWDNYGEWHIDHIKPLASFDLENREELLKACSYKNLQPLWAKDNLSKGASDDN